MSLWRQNLWDTGAGRFVSRVLIPLGLAVWSVAILLTGRVRLKSATFEGFDARVFGLGIACLFLTSLAWTVSRRSSSRFAQGLFFILLLTALCSFALFLYRNI